MSRHYSEAYQIIQTRLSQLATKEQRICFKHGQEPRLELERYLRPLEEQRSFLTVLDLATQLHQTGEHQSQTIATQGVVRVLAKKLSVR